MTRWLSSLLLTLFLATSPPVAHAHEAHRQDMSDAEMAEMRQAADAVHDGATEASGMAEPVDGATSVAAHHQEGGEQSADETFSLPDFLGRLHPALVHFPIALFLAAALAEMLLFARPASGLEPTIIFLVYTGAAGGVAAAILGWLAGGIRLSDRSETLGLHRWTGTGIALAGLSAAIILYRAKPGRMVIRLMLAGIALALLFQSYWGAEMSLGPNHMNM